jgi:outer membrane protein
MSLGLADALTRALDNDPKYQAAKADFKVASEAVPQARAGYLPTATYDYQHTATRQEATQLIPGAQPITRSYPINSGNLTITQPVIKLPAYFRMEQAKLSVEQARISLVAAEQDLIVRVASAYLNFLASQDGLDLAQAEREATQKQAELAASRLHSGLGTVTQVYDTEGRLALTQAREVDAANKLDDARSALKEIIGVPVKALKTFVGDFDAALPQPMQVDPWVAAALEQNLALQSRNLAADIAELEVKRQKAGYAPTVNLVGNVGNTRQDNSLVAGAFQGGYRVNNRDISVRLSIPIFEGGMTTSLTREAVAREEKAKDERDAELRKTERQARSAMLGLLSSGKTLAALRKSLAAQQSALEAKSEGMRSGVYSIVQVVDAYRLYYSAKRDYLQARYDYLLNRLKLKQAVGSLTRADLEDLAKLLK